MQTKIVGILNITPDSFSDGGKFNNASQALTHLHKMLFDGADMIDIGAESTRPNAVTIGQNEEWLRLEKILPQIVEAVKKFNHDQNKQIQTSIDTYHALTARKSHELGVDIINDVSGLENEEMIDFVAKNKIATVLMHSLSVPPNPEIIINSALNVVDEILNFAHQKILFLEKKGIKKSQLIFDPGIGFGKNAMQSLRILKNIETFRALNLPIYVGHSKKGFLDILNIENLSNDKESRPQKTLIISNYLARKNIDFIRVHDVLENKIAINLQNNFSIDL